MRIANGWKDFELIDTSSGERLERWGDTLLIRPDPQVIWNTPKGPLWETAHARYHRSKTGGGYWEDYSLPRAEWEIAYRELRFRIRPQGFKHTGLFPEQAVNWDWMRDAIVSAGRPVKVLNLFAYTGGATLACAAAGAEVVHVDASKGMVQCARENAALSGLGGRPTRWLVDDCKKFVERELRRGSYYDGIIMDPPSYGRGPGGEVWKLEDSIYELVALTAGLLSQNPLFYLLNSYTTGLSAPVMQYLLQVAIAQQHGGRVEGDDIGIPVSRSGGVFPCGSTAICAWQ